jgi:hypothetical protein
MKLRNYIRRRYQRTRSEVHGGWMYLLNRLIATRLTNYRHDKWTMFLSRGEGG